VPGERARCSSLYGIRIASEWALPFDTPAAPEGPPDVVIHREMPARYRDEVAEVLRRDPPRDGSHLQRRLGDALYVCWQGLFDFVVTDSGRDIFSRPLQAGAGEAFHTYLFNQVLSFALLRRGYEPLHSSSVVVAGGAVAFLGDCGYGKSSLAAACISAGHRLLTDDLLVAEESETGWIAHPGPSRMKLYPEMADHFFGPYAPRVPMNADTPKAILSIPPASMQTTAVPLAALVVLRPATGDEPGVELAPLSPREAFVAFTTNTFNDLPRGPGGLQHHLDWASRLASGVSAWRLSYPRDRGVFPEVVQRIARIAAG
jgi:hypothetical protein